MLSYKHYTLEERKYLQELLEEGYSIGKIARVLGRAPSSVSREIKRNSSSKGYHHWRAYIVSVHRRRKSHPMTRLAEDTPLGIYVRELLSKFWSPECIAETWRLQHPDDPVGFSTIYRWLKRNALRGFSRSTHLRRKGKRIQTQNANYNTIHPDRRISDWSEEIRNRLRIGDEVSIQSQPCPRRAESHHAILQQRFSKLNASHSDTGGVFMTITAHHLSMLSSTFISLSMSMGLDMWPFMPALRAFYLFSSNALAVMAMMRMRALAGSAMLRIVWLAL